MNALDDYKVDIRRSRRRRTLCLRVVDGGVRLNAPSYVSIQALEAFVLEKKAWLEKQLHASREVEHHRLSKFEVGGTFYYSGQAFRVSEKQGIRSPEIYEQILYLPATSHSRHPQALRQKKLGLWLKQKASEVLLERVQTFEVQMGLRAQKVSVLSLIHI